MQSDSPNIINPGENYEALRISYWQQKSVSSVTKISFSFFSQREATSTRNLLKKITQPADRAALWVRRSLTQLSFTKIIPIESSDDQALFNCVKFILISQKPANFTKQWKGVCTSVLDLKIFGTSRLQKMLIDTALGSKFVFENNWTPDVIYKLGSHKMILEIFLKT